MKRKILIALLALAIMIPTALGATYIVISNGVTIKFTVSQAIPLNIAWKTQLPATAMETETWYPMAVTITNTRQVQYSNVNLTITIKLPATMNVTEAIELQMLPASDVAGGVQWVTLKATTPDVTDTAIYSVKTPAIAAGQMSEIYHAGTVPAGYSFDASFQFLAYTGSAGDYDVSIVAVKG